MAIEIPLSSPSEEWGITIATYLFMGALAGGAYLTGYISKVWSEHDPKQNNFHRVTTQFGFLIGLIGTLLSGLLIISHLGAPLRAILFPITFSNITWTTIGAWVFGLFGLLISIQLIWNVFGQDYSSTSVSKKVRWMTTQLKLTSLLDRVSTATRPSRKYQLAIGAVGALFALAVMGYTGMAIASIDTVPLWDRTLIPILFVASGISIGIGIVLSFTVAVTELNQTPLHAYGALNSIAIISQIGVITWLWLRISDVPGGRESIELLTTDYQLLFFGGVLGVGLLVPLFGYVGLVAVAKRNIFDRVTSIHIRYGYITLFGFVVVGGLALRITMILAGVHEPLVLA